MKIVNVALRARRMSWNGSNGGCCRRPRMGFMTVVRSGEEYGRVMVWISSTNSAVKMR